MGWFLLIWLVWLDQLVTFWGGCWSNWPRASVWGSYETMGNAFMSSWKMCAIFAFFSCPLSLGDQLTIWGHAGHWNDDRADCPCPEALLAVLREPSVGPGVHNSWFACLVFDGGIHVHPIWVLKRFDFWTWITPPKTNMTMEHQPFEDVPPKDGDFPMLC